MRRARPHYLLSIALLASVAAIAVQSPAAADATPPAVVVAPVAAVAAATVTLITGDQVTLDGEGQISVRPGPGRTGLPFITRIDEHAHRLVIPADAISLLDSGRLDQRLFDVTALVADGYDDQHTGGRLPLLVGYPREIGMRQARTASTVTGARVVRDLSGVGVLAVAAEREARPALWRSLTRPAGAADAARTLSAGVDKVWLDGKVTIADDVSAPQIGVPAAWQAGYDGTGVTVAVLDTGIDATHPDLAGQIAEVRNFTGEPSADDTVGHGTHVASIIAGTGAASNGRYRGVAPGAKLIIGKVCASSSCSDSAVLAGMQWAAAAGAPVVNMSLGEPDAPGTGPLEQAVEDLTALYGTLFVVAAGNDGTNAPVGSPATADAALAVGAVDAANRLASFSSRGPRLGDAGLKPDITAPGVTIVAARAAHAVIGNPAPVAGYSTLSGTSMATPHVAGAVAILAQQHPDWSPLRRKTVLMASAEPTAGLSAYQQGAGRVDLARAITQTVATDQGGIGFGRQAFPHADDEPIARTVTYRNDGTEPVTLSLAVRSDLALPAGAVTAGASTLTVPAGGEAATTLTVDTRVAGPDGYWTGSLVATADGVRVTTPYAVDRETESYQVTLRPTRLDGNPAPSHYIVFVDLATNQQIVKTGTEASPVVRLPRGRYGIFTWINGPPTSMLVQPALTIDHDMTVELAAARAKPVTITVPRADAVAPLRTITAFWGRAGGAGMLTSGAQTVYTGQIAADESAPEFTAQIATSFIKAGGDLNSPYVYELTWFGVGTFFTGLTKPLREQDLATIQTSYARSASAETTGVPGLSGRAPGVTGGVIVYHPVTLPFQRPVYVNTDGGLQWYGTFQQWNGKQLDNVQSAPVTYRAGHTYRQDWNHGVFGPAGVTVTRTGDTIGAVVPMFGDGAGRPGSSTMTGSRAALYRDGEPVTGDVPAAPATYRLEASATRGAPFELSTSVSAGWTFRSGRGSGPITLPTVRFAPGLDDANTAPAGALFAIGVTVDRARSLGVEVSYDDGAHWRKALVLGGVALVWHPRTPGFVSLRGQARDAAGNTVTETVVRAYRIE